MYGVNYYFKYLSAT